MSYIENTQILADAENDLASDISYNLIRVPLRHIPDVWPGLVGFVLKGRPTDPNMTMDELVDGLLDQSTAMWVIVETAGEKRPVAVFFTQTERDRGEWVLSLFGLGGQHAKRWVMACHEAMHDYAKQEGCRRVRLCGRPAWQRILPGYRVTGEKQGHLVYERVVEGEEK